MTSSVVSSPSQQQPQVRRSHSERMLVSRHPGNHDILVSSSETALTSSATAHSNRHAHSAFDLETEQDLSIISSLSESQAAEDVRHSNKQPAVANRSAPQPPASGAHTQTSHLPPALFSAMLAPGFYSNAMETLQNMASGDAKLPPVSQSHASQHLPSVTSSFSLKPVSYDEDYVDSVSNVGDAHAHAEVPISFVNKPEVRPSAFQDRGDFVGKHLSDGTRALFQNLSAQNYEGVEFIRSQIEAQRAQSQQNPEAPQSTHRSNTSQDMMTSPQMHSSIQLHPPVQLDTSNLSGALGSECVNSSSGSTQRALPLHQDYRATWQHSLENQAPTQLGKKRL